MSFEGRSPTQLALRRFRRNRRALVCAVLLLLIGAGTAVVPVFSGYGYEEQNLDYTYDGPSVENWMGTDKLGRDLTVRVFHGGRISFAVGILATAVSLVIGIAWGALAAFAGGKVDLVMMRIVDVLYGLPYMFIVIIAMAILQSRSFVLVFVVLGAFGWLTMSRIVRGQVLSLREKEFVEAARAMGIGTAAIIWRHMIPNILGPVIVYATLTVPAVMLQEAFLSFLGLGVSPPDTSWGALIDEGARVIDQQYWWLVSFPGGLLAATLFCLNAVGDGLRDAFDVQQE